MASFTSFTLNRPHALPFVVQKILLVAFFSNICTSSHCVKERDNYDMKYLTAIGLTPGGSSTVHIYTQTIHRTTQFTQEECGPCLVFVWCTLAFALQLRKKHGKTSARVENRTIRVEKHLYGSRQNDADTSDSRYAGPCHPVRPFLALQMEKTTSR